LKHNAVYQQSLIGYLASQSPQICQHTICGNCLLQNCLGFQFHAWREWRQIIIGLKSVKIHFGHLVLDLGGFVSGNGLLDYTGFRLVAMAIF